MGFLDYYLQNSKEYQRIKSLRSLRVFRYSNYLIKKGFGKDYLRLRAIRCLKGCESESVANAAKQYVNTVLLAQQEAKVFALLKRFQEEGYSTLLCSASISPVVDAIQDLLGCNGAISSSLAVRGNILTGTIEADITGRKLGALCDVSENLDHLAVVTDNISDTDLVLAADEVFIIANSKRKVRYWERLGLSNLTFL